MSNAVASDTVECVSACTVCVSWVGFGEFASSRCCRDVCVHTHDGALRGGLRTVGLLIGQDIQVDGRLMGLRMMMRHKLKPRSRAGGAHTPAVIAAS